MQIYNASLFLEDSGPGSLQRTSDGVFSGPVTARVVSATVGVTSALPVLPPMQATLSEEGDERLLLTADQALTVTRVFSDGVSPFLSRSTAAAALFKASAIDSAGKVLEPSAHAQTPPPLLQGVELRVEMPSVSYEVSTTYQGIGVEATVTARLLASSAEACEAPLQRSFVDGACRCPEGLTGASCTVCKASAGCDFAEVCDTSFEYAESTSTKGLTCEAAPGSGLEGILSVLELQCSPSAPLPSQLSALNDADPSAGFCEMQVSTPPSL